MAQRNHRKSSSEARRGPVSGATTLFFITDFAVRSFWSVSFIQANEFVKDSADANREGLFSRALKNVM
jgi:hypothetical protein